MAGVYTLEAITAELAGDDKVKLAGVDVDGQLRGKLISKKKFLSVAESGFGFCSIVFGWDMHDKTYFRELLISNAQNGYRDLLAKVDLQSFRRIPWEDAGGDHTSGSHGVPFFLVTFHDPVSGQPVPPCPRGLLGTVVSRVGEKGWKAMAGVEYEFFNFQETSKSVKAGSGIDLEHLTPGMFGKKFNIPIEGWHTESGPGVYEAALEFGEASLMADRASLFKYVVKALGSKYGIMPCFMAKPKEGLPGNSGHMHISLVDSEGKNLFARSEPDTNPPYSDVSHLSDLGRHFLAGMLEGLPSIMPILAPTVNSYKRLVENFWAPVTVSWGLEHRAASIRLIAPPTASPKSTRFEIRTPGADANPFYVLSAILAAGLRGIEKMIELTTPPLGKGNETGGGERLARNLMEGVRKMKEEGSVAREVLGNDFVEHFTGTREHEWRLWEEAVTDWEVKRYVETV
ncbi:uncharacterized protein H6S33_005743 [Morchella sextelata]|uniref:uncharacterized protein n=1 Tax=Morchella sextelata TaxID=1174677 RepID=UPI001D0450D7|nr:uncharacterized protein H6S33_005743 [Morchella sextelata]KAH0613857.1 hypothetical protein H6S33_005743 [Morchella sextelata]